MRLFKLSRPFCFYVCIKELVSKPEALAAALTPHGLRFISGWHSLNLLTHSPDEEKKAIQPHIDLLKAMGCKICIVCETSNAIHGADDCSVNDKPHLADDKWEEFGADVDEIAQYCADQGIMLAYHHHMGTVVETPDEIERFMSVPPACGLGAKKPPVVRSTW